MIKMLQYKMYPAGELRCPTTALVALFLLHGWWISGFMALSMLFQSYQAGASTLHVLACISFCCGPWDPCTYGNPILISKCHSLHFMLKQGHIKYVLLKISLLQWGSNNCNL